MSNPIVQGRDGNIRFVIAQTHVINVEEIEYIYHTVALIEGRQQRRGDEIATHNHNRMIRGSNGSPWFHGCAASGGSVTTIVTTVTIVTVTTFTIVTTITIITTTTIIMNQRLESRQMIQFVHIIDL